MVVLDPYSRCHVLGLIPSPPTFLFRLTAIGYNARHSTHENISATTHSITSGHSTNQTTTGLCPWGGALPFGLAVPHSRPVALNLEPSPLAWICLPPGINTTLGHPLTQGNMIRSRRCCLCYAHCQIVPPTGSTVLESAEAKMGRRRTV